MVSGRFSSTGVADVTNPKTESDEGKYVLPFTVAAKHPLLWSLPLCDARPCSRIKIVRYIFTHGPKNCCLSLYCEVSCKTQSQLVVARVGNTHNQSPAHHHRYLTTVVFILCRCTAHTCTHLVTMVFCVPPTYNSGSSVACILRLKHLDTCNNRVSVNPSSQASRSFIAARTS